MIPDEAVEAAVDALLASKLGDHPGINGEEFVEAAHLALEAAARHLLAAFVSDMLDEMRSWVGDKELGFIEGVIESCEEEATK